MAVRVISSSRRKKRTTKPTILGGRCEEKAWSRWAASSEPPLEQKNVPSPEGLRAASGLQRKKAQRVQRRVPRTTRRYFIGPRRVTPPA